MSAQDRRRYPRWMGALLIAGLLPALGGCGLVMDTSEVSIVNEDDARTVVTSKWAVGVCTALADFRAELAQLDGIRQATDMTTMAGRKAYAREASSAVHEVSEEAIEKLREMQPPADARPYNEAILHQLSEVSEEARRVNGELRSAKTDADLQALMVRLNVVSEREEEAIEEAFEDLSRESVAAVSAVPGCGVAIPLEPTGASDSLHTTTLKL